MCWSLREWMRAKQLQWGHNVSVVEICSYRQVTKKQAGASMGPQRFRCGNQSDTTPTNTKCTCFNGATTFPLWKLPQGLGLCQKFPWLQWGHNVSVVEIRLHDQMWDLATIASMGPQRFRCGNLSGRRRRSQCSKASMGPQRFRCGNQCWNCIISKTSDASMGPQRFRCGNFLRFRLPHRRFRGFNGATTFPLWKSHNSRLEARVRNSLQWGHNVSVVEIKRQTN